MTLFREDFILVPLPAASTIAERISITSIIISLYILTKNIGKKKGKLR